ncbi:MAG: hypothetical protein IPI11_16455 [Haliscomenobacter sp.]|nr:hypothetical protein [Haliscomenobacter sp.]
MKPTNKLFILLLVLVAGAGVFFYRGRIFNPSPLNLGKRLPFTMVEFYGDTTLLLQLSNNLNTAVNPSGAAVPLSDQTLLYFMGDSISSFYLYRKEDGRKIRYEMAHGKLRINGKLSALSVDSTETSARALKSMNEDSIQNLRLVVIQENIRESVYPDLFRLAKINPRISFIGESFGDLSDKDSILLQGLWKPTLPGVIIAEDTDLPFLDLREAHTLFLNKEDSILAPSFFNAMKTVPDNGKLWLDGFEEDEIKTIIQETHPREIAVVNTEIQTPATLTSWTGIQSLVVEDTLSDLAPLSQLGELEWLSAPVGEGAKGIEAVKNLRFLQVKTSSKELNALLKNNRGLEYLHFRQDSLEALPDLMQLSRLAGLTIPKPEGADLGQLKELKALKYLGTPAQDSLLQTLKPYCPECLVYGQGYDFWGSCLGSGWLLLIFPLIWFFVRVNPILKPQKP